jgi:hypothetical protein
MKELMIAYLHYYMLANYNDFAGELDISVELATSLNPGIATFDATDFLVTAGNVEIQTIDCGSY